jgi:pimeloyl-ACP methyl ester carboxylesterase
VLTPKTQTIVYIPGILNFPPYWRISNHLMKAYSKRFPDAVFATEDCFYFPWEKTKMLRFAEEILKKNDVTGQEVILLGYSMGGVIATAIAPRFKHAKVRVITLMAPHTFLWGLFPKMLGSSLSSDGGIDIVSFQGWLDWAVVWGAKHPHARKHHKIFCDHLVGLLFSSQPAEKIAEASK